jgi:glycosyltransferase involved in cell wall biosynthesis
MGTATYRKGIDLFLEVCKELREDPEFFFVWIGDFVDDASKKDLYNDIESLSSSGNLLITGFLPHSSSNLLPFDLFCLSSREDPYPLVVIEAALQKVPSLCFDSGGASEFISGACGWLVEDFAPKAMAKKIKELKRNKKEIEIIGNNAFNKAVSIHLNEEKIFFQFDSIIKQVLT